MSHRLFSREAWLKISLLNGFPLKKSFSRAQAKPHAWSTSCSPGPEFLLSLHCFFPLCLFKLIPFCQVELIRRKLLGEQPYSHCVRSACDPHSVDRSRSISLYPDITSDPVCWGSVTLGKWFSSKGRQTGNRDIWEFGFLLALFDCLVPFYMLLAKGEELLLWAVGFLDVYSFGCV